MTIYQYISLLWTRFTPLEKRLLAEARAVLPEAARPIFDAQVSAITKSQRILQWNEICYYRMRFGKPFWDGCPLFPCTDEMQVAEIRFKVAGRRFKATLWSIAGHVFSFTLQPGGRSIAFAPWDETPKTTLLDDPMRQSTGHGRPEPILPVWTEFLKKHEKVEWTDWTLYNQDAVYSVSLEAGEFLILAERAGDEFVLQRVDPPSDRLFYLESHDGTPEVLSKELESVIKE